MDWSLFLSGACFSSSHRPLGGLLRPILAMTFTAAGRGPWRRFRRSRTTSAAALHNRQERVAIAPAWAGNYRVFGMKIVPDLWSLRWFHPRFFFDFLLFSTIFYDFSNDFPDFFWPFSSICRVFPTFFSTIFHDFSRFSKLFLRFFQRFSRPFLTVF